MRYLLQNACLITAVALMGCDSQEPTAEPPTFSEIKVLKAIPDALLFAGGSPHVIDLKNYFSHEKDQAISYRMEAQEGEGVGWKIEQHDLHLFPGYASTNRLTVRGYTAGDAGATASFQVKVTEAIKRLASVVDTLVNRNQGEIVLDLNRYFARAHPDTVTYQLRQHSGYAVTSELRGDSLLLTPVDTGQDVVAIVAQVASFYAEIRVEIEVVLPPDSTLISYFPHEVGQSWVYDYTHSFKEDCCDQGRSTVGTVTWTVLRHVQNNGVVGVWIKEEGDAVRTYEYTDQSDTLHWEKEKYVTLMNQQLAIPGITRSNDSRWELTAHWLHPPDTASVVEYYKLVNCFRGCHEVVMQLEAGRGMIYWDNNNGQAGGTNRYRMTLRE